MYGRLTLTNYVIQNFIGLLLLSGFGLITINLMPYYVYLLIGFSIYFLQVVFSSWWLKKYNFGPLEWLWRCTSYNNRLPLLKKEYLKCQILYNFLMRKYLFKNQHQKKQSTPCKTRSILSNDLYLIINVCFLFTNFFPILLAGIFPHKVHLLKVSGGILISRPSKNI